MSDQDRVLICGPRVGQEAWASAYDDAGRIEYLLRDIGDCLAEFGVRGVSRVFPPVAVKCGYGPKRQCIKSASPTEIWEYAPPTAASFPVWAKIAEHSEYETAIRFHRTIEWEKIGEDCRITNRAVADLDDDGVYATYERSALIKADGIVLSAHGPDGFVEPIEIPEKEPGPIPPLPPEIAAHPDLKCNGLTDADRVGVCGPTLAQQVFEWAKLTGQSTYSVVHEAKSCLGDLGETGSSEWWPPKTVDCVAGPKHACVAVEGAPSKPWEFTRPTEEEDPVWSYLIDNGLKLPDRPTHFHSKLSWEKKGTECFVTFEAVADLNRDGKFGSSRSTIVFDAAGEFVRSLSEFPVTVPE